MMNRLFFSLLLSGAVVLSLSACSDPTGVGANLGGDSLEEGTPRSVEVMPSRFDTTTVPPLTGFDGSSPNAADRSWRFLTGAVKDPIAGVIEAEGYLDFFGAEPRPESIRNATADSLDAELELVPTYVHGDTLSTVTVNLFTLESEVEDMHRLPADTSFSTGNPLSPPGQPGTAHSFSPTDSVVTLPLPASWIENHLSALQADTFDTDINGFVFRSADEPSTALRRAVVGFSLQNATLRVMSASDTVRFQSLKSHTHVERRGTPEVPLDDWTLLQDGVGTSLVMGWNFEEAPFDSSLANQPLNRADVTVPVDTTKMEASLSETSVNFVRPRVNNYRMTATRSTDASSCSNLGFFELRDNPETCILLTNPNFAPGSARLLSRSAFAIFEQALSPDTTAAPFTAFQVGIALQQNPSPEQSRLRGLPSTAPALVRTTSADTTDLPRATLTVTPL